jgi:hypothetical protein
MRLSVRRFLVGVLVSLAALSFYGAVKASSPDMPAKQDSGAQTETPMPAPDDQGQGLRIRQSQDDVDAKSAGCQSCHTATDSVSMHKSPAVRIGCTDCHGGDATVSVAAGISPQSPEYQGAKERAHPKPKVLQSGNSANPVRAYTDWLKEDSDYIRFVNPGDLRVASTTCGASGCHAPEVQKVRTSMMTHGAMLWGAALYNNGAFPMKTPHFGESYSKDGLPQRLITFPPPTPEETRLKGVLPFLEPIQRWEISQPGNVLRIFERGGEKRPGSMSGLAGRT